MIYRKRNTVGRKDGHCSFCRKSYRDVGLLFKGQGRIYICGECIDLFRPILIRERRRRAQQASKSTHGVAPNESDSSLLVTVKTKELINSLDVRLKAIKRLLLCHRAERRQQWHEMDYFWASADFDRSRINYGYKGDDAFGLIVPAGYEDMRFFDYAGGYACAMLLVSFFSEFLDELWLLAKESDVAPTREHRSFEHLPIHRKIETFKEILSLSLEDVVDSMTVIHKLVIDRNYIVHRGGIWDERYMARPGALPLTQYNLDRRHIYIADEFIDEASAAIRAVCQYICEHLAPRLQRTSGV